MADLLGVGVAELLVALGETRRLADVQLWRCQILID